MLVCFRIVDVYDVYTNGGSVVDLTLPHLHHICLIRIFVPPTHINLEFPSNSILDTLRNANLRAQAATIAGFLTL